MSMFKKLLTNVTGVGTNSGAQSNQDGSSEGKKPRAYSNTSKEEGGFDFTENDDEVIDVDTRPISVSLDSN